MSVFDRVENIVGHGKDTGYQHFLVFPKCFKRFPVQGQDCMVMGKFVVCMFVILEISRILSLSIEVKDFYFPLYYSGIILKFLQLLQVFDIALTPLRIQLLAEEPSPSRILQTGKFFR